MENVKNKSIESMEAVTTHCVYLWETTFICKDEELGKMASKAAAKYGFDSRHAWALISLVSSARDILHELGYTNEEIYTAIPIEFTYANALRHVYVALEMAADSLERERSELIEDLERYLSDYGHEPHQTEAVKAAVKYLKSLR